MTSRCDVCLRAQVKDQQEAERKKQTSQEIQQAQAEQNKVIALKKETVRADLAQVEPAVIEAQQGARFHSIHLSNTECICLLYDQ